MLKFISWVIALIIGLVAVLFAVSNRAPVSIDFWPLPLTESVPLFVIVLIAAAAGFIVGGIVAWFSAGRVRQRARFARQQVSHMEQDLKTLNDRIHDLEEKQRPPAAGA